VKIENQSTELSPVKVRLGLVINLLWVALFLATFGTFVIGFGSLTACTDEPSNHNGAACGNINLASIINGLVQIGLALIATALLIVFASRRKRAPSIPSMPWRIALVGLIVSIGTFVGMMALANHYRRG